MSERTFSWKDHAPATLSSILFISQIVVGVYLLPEFSQIEVLAYFGVGLYVFSGMILGMLPVFEFRKTGEVRKGQSYIHTTKLVDTGIYSVVRHPQYVTFIMWAISGMLLFQNWIVILLGVPIIPLIYIDLIRADRACLKRFGDDYKAYMKKVPRANFLLGIIRRFRKSDNRFDER
jgi:protein-S-isoprenylcysteine O-methyltransferase Ste14